MELPLGITGQQGRKDPVPEPPLTDLKAFRAHCHHAARINCATVQTIRDPYECGSPSNYAVARIRFSDNNVVLVLVLVNQVRPIVAFAKAPSVEWQITFEFIDCAKLADAFLEVAEYIIAASEELNRPLLREMCKDLAPREKQGVRYYRPARVGDVIFNYWD